MHISGTSNDLSKSWRCLLSAGLLFVLAAYPASASTIFVDGSCGHDSKPGTSASCADANGPKLTIQAGIDAVSDTDEVVVAPGTYNEVINLLSKAIALRSSGGADVTIIDGTGLNDSVVKCATGEGSDTVIKGFTITGGTGSACPSNITSSGGGALPLEPEIDPIDKPRFISFVVPTDTPGIETAIRVELTSLYHPNDPQPVNQPDFSPHEGQFRYLNALVDGDGIPVYECGDSSAWGTFYPCATLGCQPEYRDWAAIFGGNDVHVTGNAVIPDSQYTLAHLPPGCQGIEETCDVGTEELVLTTARYGDTNGDGSMDVTDIVNTVDKVKQLFISRPERFTYFRDQYPAPHNEATNTTDIALSVDALKLITYVYPILLRVRPRRGLHLPRVRQQPVNEAWFRGSRHRPGNWEAQRLGWSPSTLSEDDPRQGVADRLRIVLCAIGGVEDDDTFVDVAIKVGEEDHIAAIVA